MTDRLKNHPEACEWGVLRSYGYEPCGKPAVSAARDEDCPDDLYAVCVHHTRKETAVPLTELLKALS